RLQDKHGRALCISQSTGLVEVLGFRPVETVSANYPEHNLLTLGFPDASFDWVLSDQVLEHVEGDPQTAIDECRRRLRPGGNAVQTPGLINSIHAAPSDFWRFTPDGLSLLHRGWSEILEVGGWGNFQVWNVVQDGIRFAGVPHARWHPLHRLAMKNDPLWP